MYSCLLAGVIACSQFSRLEFCVCVFVEEFESVFF